MRKFIYVSLICFCIALICLQASRPDGEYVRIKYEAYLFEKEFSKEISLEKKDLENAIRRIEGDRPGRWVVSTHPSRLIQTKIKYKNTSGSFQGKSYYFIGKDGKIGRD